MTDATSPAMSVIVMGYRNEATVLRAVRSVTTQRSPEPFEVIVVTSGGDATAAVLKRNLPGLDVFESASPLLPGGARNEGLMRARGEFVAFLAADCVAARGWVQTRLDRHRAGFPAVASALTCIPPWNPFALASHFLLFSPRLTGRPPGFVTASDPAGHSLSYDRSVLDRLGPFDESVGVGEDTQAASRLAEIGEPIWFEPAVRTGHSGPSGPLALVRDQFGRASRHARAQGRPAGGARGGVGGLCWEALRGVRPKVVRTVRLACRYGSRTKVLWSAPWICLGATAARAGWLDGQLRARRHLPSRASVGACD